MKVRRLASGGAAQWVLIFEKGEEAIKGLQSAAREHKFTAASFTAIGAFQDVVLGYFDWEKKDYRRIPVSEQVEVLSLIGDISLKENEPEVHAHVVLGRADGSAMGGHLMSGVVRPTLEVMLTESPQHLERRFDPETGLSLIKG